MKLVAIAAVAENGVIACDGEIPWDYPADKEFYRATIRGHPAIMGRKTFDGDGKPGCTNIVLTSQDLDLGDDVIVAHSVDDAVDAAAATGEGAAYVIGGAGVYESFMPRLDRLVITHVPGEYEGDRYFPHWDENDWTQLRRHRLTDELVVVEYEP